MILCAAAGEASDGWCWRSWCETHWRILVATLVENTEPHWSRLEAGKCIVYRGRLASVDLHSSCVAAHQLYLAAGSAVQCRRTSSGRVW